MLYLPFKQNVTVIKYTKTEEFKNKTITYELCVLKIIYICVKSET